MSIVLKMLLNSLGGEIANFHGNCVWIFLIIGQIVDCFWMMWTSNSAELSTPVKYHRYVYNIGPH